MSYYVRFLLTDSQAITIPELDTALRAIDPGYEIDGDTLVLNDKEIGQVEINEGDDPILAGDIEMLRERAENWKSEEKILAMLDNATSVVVVQPIWTLGDNNATITAIQPLFDWLLANRKGIIADEGGEFINANGPLP